MNEHSPRLGHHYSNDPRVPIKLAPGSLQQHDQSSFERMQESYFELLHDRLIEEVTEGISLDTTICRIDTLDRFIVSVTNKELFLSSPSRWEDPWENFVLRADAYLQDGTKIDISAIRDSFFAQCWTSAPECEGLWTTRYYSPNNLRKETRNNGVIELIPRRLVKIKTTVRALMREVYKLQDPCGHERFRIGAVCYRSKDCIESMHQAAFKDPSIEKQTEEIIQSLLTKRIGFEYEKEIRLVYHEPWINRDPSDPIRSFINLEDIDFHNFLQGIEIDPWCSDDDFNAIKEVLESDCGLHSIEQSSLRKESSFPTVIFGQDCIVYGPNHAILSPARGLE